MVEVVADMELDLVVRAQRVVTPHGEVARCIGVRDGKVVAIEAVTADLDAREVLEQLLHTDLAPAALRNVGAADGAVGGLYTLAHSATVEEFGGERLAVGNTALLVPVQLD